MASPSDLHYSSHKIHITGANKIRRKFPDLDNVPTPACMYSSTTRCDLTIYLTCSGFRIRLRALLVRELIRIVTDKDWYMVILTRFIKHYASKNTTVVRI